MVLSTSELKPTANMPGLQGYGALENAGPSIKTVNTIQPERMRSNAYHSVCSINPATPSELVVAVPALQRDSNQQTLPDQPYLQTFNLSRDRHIARQALARSNATDSNIAPGGKRLREPNLAHLDIAHNGQWLATVDEWFPQLNDVEDMQAERDARTVAKRYREIQLKVWSRNSDNTWMLNTRIDGPHRDGTTQTSGRVLDLTMNPRRTQFTTIGTDACVRTWRLKTEKKKAARGQDISKIANTDSWWILEFVIRLEHAMSVEELSRSDPQRSRIAYSADGTAIAVYQHFEKSVEHGVIHFIDAQSGKVQNSYPGLYPYADGIHALGFLGRNLICLGKQVALVWDVTSFELCLEIPLQNSREERALKVFNRKHRPQKTQAIPISPLLAIDNATCSFAIATHELKRPTNRIESITQYRSRIAVYSLKDGVKPLFETVSRAAVTALLAANGGVSNDSEADHIRSLEQGYIMLDCEATIRTIDPQASVRDIPPSVPIHDDQNVAQVEGREVQLDAEEEQTEPGALEEDVIMADATDTLDELLASHQRSSRPVVRPEQLAAVFDYPTLAMPPMKELFRSVMELYSK